MENIYRSPYEAYPFLSDETQDLRCDFELLTDEIASRIGLLRAKTTNEALREELLWLCEMIYHLNPALRTAFKITDGEIERLSAAVERLKKDCGGRFERFVLTQGCETACLAHILRVQGKVLTRLVYRHCMQGHKVSPRLLDFTNLLSGYFFYLALKLNKDSNIDEVEFVSRNY